MKLGWSLALAALVVAGSASAQDTASDKGKLSYGSYGIGSHGQLACSTLSDLAGQDAKYHHARPADLIKAVRSFLAAKAKIVLPADTSIRGHSDIFDRFERFKLEVIATTDAAIDDLKWHKMINESGWTGGRVVPTYRPDNIVDPDKPSFQRDLDTLDAITGCDTGRWQGYLDAHRKRREFFKSMGATASAASPRAGSSTMPRRTSDRLT